MPRWPTRTRLQPQRRPARRSASAPPESGSHTAPKTTAALPSDPSLRRRRVGAPSSKMASAKRAQSLLCTVAPGESEPVVQVWTRDVCGPRTSVCPVCSGPGIYPLSYHHNFMIKGRQTKMAATSLTSSHSTETKPKHPDISADISVLFGFRVSAF